MSVARVVLMPCGLQDKQIIAADRKTNNNRFLRTNCKYRETVIDKRSGNVRRESFFYLRNTIAYERERKV